MAASISKLSRKYLLTALATLLVDGALLHAPVASAQAQAAPSAAEALRAGDYSKALQISNELLLANPQDCRFLTIRGIALERLRQPREADAALGTAVQTCPGFLPALEALGQNEYAEHDAKAAETLNKLLAIAPNEPTANAMLGAIEFARGNCGQAVARYEKAGSVLEQDEEATRQFGACLFTTGGKSRAEEVLRALLAKHGSTPNRLSYAYVCWKNKEYAAALQSLKPLLPKDAENPKALALAAKIAEEMGDTPHATEWLREAIIADPGDAENYLFFATLSFTHASYKVGIDVLNAGLHQLPSDARLYLARGVLSMQVSQPESAMLDFQRAKDLDPKMSSVADAMAIFEYQKHESATAQAILRQQVILHPDDPLLEYLYADALSEQIENGSEGTLKTAIRAAEHSLKVEPDYQLARDLLCRLYLEADLPESAVAQVEEALRRDENDDVALYQGIVAYRRLGNRERSEALVSRLKDCRERQQAKRIQYLLTEKLPQPE